MNIAILALIAHIASQEGVPPRLAQELAIWESNLSPNMVGVTGDIGLFQLNRQYIPFFMEKFWDREDDFDAIDPEHNATVALRYLVWIRKHYDCNWWQAVVAYNSGPQKALVKKQPAHASIEMANRIIEASTHNGSYENFKPKLVE